MINKMTQLLGMLLIASIVCCGQAFAAAELHKAAHNGDLKTVKTLLHDKPDPDERDSFGGTALHAAMFQDNTEIIELLIEYGLDVNAQGLSNGYTPLHDAVWADNLDAVKILLEHGAKTDLKAKDGLTPYEKAKKEGKDEIAAYLESRDIGKTSYDETAKTTYSENDVKAFVYSWFAGFDHQANIEVFTQHLDPSHVDMAFPDFPITGLQDFERWYDGVRENIQWNTHKLSNISVSGNEHDGFSVSLDVNWMARSYQGDHYDMHIHQDWNVEVDTNRNFLIKKHRATVIE